MSDDLAKGTVSGQWKLLRAGGRDSRSGIEVPSLPLETRTAAGLVRLAIGPNGEARLLVPLAHDERSPDVEPGPALRISIATFSHKGRASRFLDLMCLSAELEGVFADIVDEILARIEAGSGISEAVTGTIEDFRTLIVPPSSRRPDTNRVAGLVAELVVLNRLLDISNTAWRAWRGPAGDRHDFRVRDDSLEVKASLRAGAGVVTINGLEQLEPPAGGTLHLLHMTLEPVDGGLLSVSALGGQALSCADDPPGLRDLLVAAGCDDINDPGWNRHAFRLDAERLYSVSTGFPCIAPSRFEGGKAPVGIVDATYRIDLGFATECELPPARMGALLKEFAS